METVTKETDKRNFKIYFGQVFYPYGLEENGRFIVIDTQNGPHIEASRITEKTAEGDTTIKLSLAGSFPLQAVNNCQDIWDKDKVIKTFMESFSSIPFQGNVKDLLMEYSQQPPREVSPYETDLKI
jgi:hypothetical protein